MRVRLCGPVFTLKQRWRSRKWSKRQCGSMVFLVCSFSILLFCYSSCQYLVGYPKLESSDNTDVTLVTAYLNLGSFQKGGKHLTYTQDNYLRWSATFQYLQNPLLVFTDCQLFALHCAKVFANGISLGQVKVIMVNRTQLNTFAKYLPKFTAIFDDPTYPKFHPNTVMPEYALTQHAKIDFVEEAIKMNYFRTKYYSWIDIGYFRDISLREKKFWLTVPADLGDEEVALNEVRSPMFHLTPAEIFHGNLFWVGGGMILGTRFAHASFIEDYRRALKHFLEQGLANTDQQLIYSMFSNDGRRQQRYITKIHSYKWPPHLNSGCWFYLGYRCYREGEKEDIEEGGLTVK